MGAVPNKNAGFIVLLTSIFVLFLSGEIRMMTIFTRLMDCNNGFSLYIFFLSFLSFLWIGAQFPLEKFLSYARIMTFYYYFFFFFFFFLKKKKKKKKKKKENQIHTKQGIKTSMIKRKRDEPGILTKQDKSYE